MKTKCWGTFLYCKNTCILHLLPQLTVDNCWWSNFWQLIVRAVSEHTVVSWVECHWRDQVPLLLLLMLRRGHRHSQLPTYRVGAWRFLQRTTTPHSFSRSFLLYSALSSLVNLIVFNSFLLVLLEIVMVLLLLLLLSYTVTRYVKRKGER